MMTLTGTSMEAKGRARGLVLVWRRELEQKLQINDYLPRCRRWKTLEILVERRPGDQQQTSDQSGIENCHMESAQM